MSAATDGVSYKYYLSTFHKNASKNRLVRVSFDDIPSQKTGPPQYRRVARTGGDRAASHRLALHLFLQLRQPRAGQGLGMVLANVIDKFLTARACASSKVDHNPVFVPVVCRRPQQ